MDLSSLGIGLRNQKVFTKEPWVWEKENMSWKSENIERGRKALLAMVFCHSHLPKPGNVKMFYNTKKVSPKKFQLKENIFIFICAHYRRNGNGRYFVFRKSSSYPCLRIPIEYPSHGLFFCDKSPVEDVWLSESDIFIQVCPNGHLPFMNSLLCFAANHHKIINTQNRLLLPLNEAEMRQHKA